MLNKVKFSVDDYFPQKKMKKKGLIDIAETYGIKVKWYEYILIGCLRKRILSFLLQR